MELGIENGLTVEELGEAIAHIAFYAGWPVAISAARKLKTLVDTKAAPD
jgi:4-carboxymuconolactone decarboxylase